MNRTLAFVFLAAALTLTAAAQPVARWWERRQLTREHTAAVASAAGALRLEAALSHRRPLEGGATFVRYDVRASDATVVGAEQPVQLALVIDRSGSMAGEKIARAREAALAFVELLEPQDEVALVTFGSDTTELPLRRADTEGKEAMRRFIANISESGGTNISAGLERASALLEAAPVRGVRRVVLMSDGRPTEGTTNVEDLVRLVLRIHGRRMAVTSLGIGYDFDGVLMHRLSQQGGGFYAYLDDPKRLTTVLALELLQARRAVARNATLRLELSGGVELVQVAGREVSSSGNVARVPLPDFAAGQTAQAFVELRLPPGTIAFEAVAWLEYVDAAGNSTTGAPAALSANTTADAQEAEASKDVMVTAACILAIGSTQMVAAAQAFERGDRSAANGLMSAARGIFSQSADALAGEIADVEKTTKRWANTHDAQAISHEAKGLSRKKMLNFGENNAY